MANIDHAPMSRRSFCLCCVSAATFAASGDWLSPSQAFAKAGNLVELFRAEAAKATITVHKLRRMADSEVDFADYLPKTTKNIDELWLTLVEFVNSFQDPHLRTVVEAFMSDPEIAAAYRSAPAAKTLHHAFIGIELVVHLVLQLRGRPSFYNGLG